jgi:hypothetical protein
MLISLSRFSSNLLVSFCLDTALMAIGACVVYGRRDPEMISGRGTIDMETRLIVHIGVTNDVVV